MELRELTLQDHFRYLELMTLKYAGGNFVTDAAGERSYQIADLEPQSEVELALLSDRLKASHSK